MSVNLVHPGETTTGVWIVQSGTSIEALSACCNRVIHWSMSAEQWFCSVCKLNLVAGTVADGSIWRGSSTYFLADSAREIDFDELTDWVSFWTGLTEDLLKISVSF